MVVHLLIFRLICIKNFTMCPTKVVSKYMILSTTYFVGRQ